VRSRGPGSARGKGNRKPGKPAQREREQEAGGTGSEGKGTGSRGNRLRGKGNRKPGEPAQREREQEAGEPGAALPCCVFEDLHAIRRELLLNVRRLDLQRPVWSH